MNSNLIVPPLTPEQLPAVPESGVNAVVTDIPPQLAGLRPGETLLLETLLNLSGKNGAFTVNVDIGGSKVPLMIEPETPLPLSPDSETPQQLTAKVVSVRPEALRLKFIAVDNQKITAPAPNRSETPNAASSALVKDISSQTLARIMPLRLDAAASFLMTKAGIAPHVQQQVLTALPLLEAEIAVLPQPVTSVPLQGGTGALLPGADAFLPPLPSNTPEISQQTPQKIIGQLQTLLSSLPGRELPAVTAADASGTQPVLQTPLGRLVLETPLRLPPETSVTIQFREVSFRPVEPLPQLLENLSRLLEKLPLDSDDGLLSRLRTVLSENSPKNMPLLRLLEPLRHLPASLDLPQRILERIPALNGKMLPNLHAFYKAASEGRTEAWLGKELTAELRAAGAEGKETLARLGEFVSAHSREGVSWRQVTIPFFDGQTLSQIKVALKKNREEEEEKNGKPAGQGSRFLVETEFSRLGKFQFDGFSVAAERRFDLVIRTSHPAEKDLCAHIMNLFKTSLYHVGYAGNLKFGIQENFVKVVDEEMTRLKDGVYI